MGQEPIDVVAIEGSLYVLAEDTGSVYSESEVQVVRVAPEQAGLEVSAEQVDAWIVVHAP